MASRGGRSIRCRGGQLQRALFARVLVQDAPVMLLDEPFTAIDEQTVSDLMALVGRWHAEGRTVIAVLHDFDDGARAFPADPADGARADWLGRRRPSVLTTDNLRGRVRCPRRGTTTRRGMSDHGTITPTSMAEHGMTLYDSAAGPVR